MRPAAWVFALFLMSCAPAFAAVRYGFDIGVNVSSFHYERDSGFPMSLWRERHEKVVPTIGGVLEIPVGERLAIATGLRYVQHGLRVDVDDVFTTGFEHTLHYLSAPLLLSVRPLPSKRIFLAAGPEVALLIAAEGEVLSLGAGPGGSSVSIKDDMDPTNFSLDGEVGVEFPMGPQAGRLAARYSHGVVGVAKKSHWFSDWSTRGMEVLFGVRW